MSSDVLLLDQFLNALPYDDQQAESCIAHTNPMLPVPDYMRIMFQHLSGCGDAASLEASLWIMHAASLTKHDLSGNECMRLLFSVMRGMCVCAPELGLNFPHMCNFEADGLSPLFTESVLVDPIEYGDTAETEPHPATLNEIAYELEIVLRGIRKTGGIDCLSVINPLCPKVFKAVHDVCRVVSRLYDVILLSHICHRTPGCCSPMEKMDDTIPTQSFMVFRMLPADLARLNTCRSLPPLQNFEDLLSDLSSDPMQYLGDNPPLTLSIVRLQQVLSSAALNKQSTNEEGLKGTAHSVWDKQRVIVRRAIKDVLVNHWSLAKHQSLGNRQAVADLHSPIFWENLTTCQMSVIKVVTTQALEWMNSTCHREHLSQCLERRSTLTLEQHEWMQIFTKELDGLLCDFVTSMQEGQASPEVHAYMSDMVTPSMWCHSHRFNISDREWLYEQQVSEYLERCRELGRQQWRPEKHIYCLDDKLWEQQFSNWVCNMREFDCQLTDFGPPVLAVVGGDASGPSGIWMMQLLVYNPVAHTTHVVRVPLNLALRLNKPMVQSYFQSQGMEVPKSLKNVARTGMRHLHF